jgi:hypothetical protein
MVKWYQFVDIRAFLEEISLTNEAIWFISEVGV